MENNLYDINLIADYTISKNESSIMHFKVQKLLYYIQAWSLSILDKPLFDGDFEAWVHGPVYKRYMIDLGVYIHLFPKKTPKLRRLLTKEI